MRSLLIIFFLFSNPILNAKSWYFDSIHIKAIISEDGSMHIQEARSYHFKGNFRWADYNLSLQPNQEISNFTISERDAEYQRNDSEDDGTFEIEKMNNRFYAKWFYHAKNESRIFNLDYSISNVVTSYADIAELYWKFIGEANPEFVESVIIEIELPQKARFGDVKAWAHGPLWGNVEFKHEKIFLTVNQLPEGQYVEARIVFPKSWVVDNRNIKEGQQESRILKEEENFSFKANERRKQAIINEEQKIIDNARAYDIAWPLLIVLIIIFILLYRKYGVGFSVNYNQKIDANIPKDMHPVLLNCIYFGKAITGSTLSTMIFYLAQKGILQLEIDTENTKKWYDSSEPIIIKLDRKKWQGDKTDLSNYENDFIDFLFNTLSDGEDQISSRKLKKASSKMHKWFTSWKKILKSHLDQNNYYDKESIKGAIMNASISFLFLISGIVLVATLGSNGVLLLVPAVLFLGLSMSILRFTPETKLLKKKLAALRNYLKSFKSESFQQSDLNYISDYFLFAIAFGLGKKVVGNIIDVIPAEQHAAFFPWYIGAVGSSDFSSTINSVVIATGTSISSASGAGGGMSAGAGAGGGGAAGGAG